MHARAHTVAACERVRQLTCAVADLVVFVRRYGLVWGVSAKHQPQRVGIVHPMGDEDVVQVMTK